MKKRFGDRYDGRRVRHSDPTNMIIPFIMRERNDAEVFFDAEVNMSRIDELIREKRKNGEEARTLDYIIAIIDVAAEIILIELENRQGIVSEISNAIDIAGSRIESINSDQKDEKSFIINLVVTVRDRLHLAGVIRRIKSVPNIISITRRR